MPDYAPWVLLGIMLSILPIILVVGILKLLKNRKALRNGWLAVEEGRLAEASKIFKELASRTLDFFVGLGKEPFDEALRGLSRVYQEAGRAVDLEAIRQIRRSIRALEKGSTKTVGEKLTSGVKLGEALGGLKAGWKIENLVQEGRSLIVALPDL
jgi:hypothetical protein